MPILGANSSGGSRPSAPTIGSASDGGTGTTASVAFTPSSYIGKGTITYTATSSPGNLTGTGSSPITVSGLTTGTAYTFTVQGTTNYGVASASSAASNSVTPVTPSSYESIATFTGNNTTSSYTFSSIPSGYKSLQIRMVGRSDGGSAATRMRLNGDSGSNYNSHGFWGFDGITQATNNATTQITVGNNQIGIGPDPTGLIIDLIDYASTSKNKTIKSFYGISRNIAGNNEVGIMSGLWRNTAAVNSITIFSNVNYTAGTTIALYGVK